MLTSCLQQNAVADWSIKELEATIIIIYYYYLYQVKTSNASLWTAIQQKLLLPW